MRTVALVLTLTMTGSPVLASVVIPGASPGIVAQGGHKEILDHLGHVWSWAGPESGWVRWAAHDVPVPIREIRFWEPDWFVTTSSSVWVFVGDEWMDLGEWPGAASVLTEPADGPVAAAHFPNPVTRTCRIVFRTESEGAVSIQVVDVFGRIIRHLLDGVHPAGDYSLVWDGRDDAGREVPAGVYMTRIETLEAVTAGRVVLAR